jgi:hypothetical protein
MNEKYVEEKKYFTLTRPNLDAAKDVTAFSDVFGNQTASRSFFSKPNSRRDAAKLSTSSLNDLYVYRFSSPTILHKHEIE